MMTPFNLKAGVKGDEVNILFLKLGQNYYHTSFTSYLSLNLCKFDEASCSTKFYSILMICQQSAIMAILLSK